MDDLDLSSIPLPEGPPPELPPLPPSEDFVTDKLAIKDDQEKKVEDPENMEKETKELNYGHGEDEKEDDDSDDEGDIVVTKLSRSEQKSRKAMMKLGYEPVSGVSQVTLTKPSGMYVIPNPDVFKSPSSETYVFFGELMRAEDANIMTKPIQEELMKALLSGQCWECEECAEMSAIENEEERKKKEVVPDPLDIEMVMRQTSVSWAEAANALIDADNDVITAIMELMNF